VLVQGAWILAGGSGDGGRRDSRSWIVRHDRTVTGGGGFAWGLDRVGQFFFFPLASRLYRAILSTGFKIVRSYISLLLNCNR
jgi:hypothetical protein